MIYANTGLLEDMPKHGAQLASKGSDQSLLKERISVTISYLGKANAGNVHYIITTGANTPVVFMTTRVTFYALHKYS